jgi:hypothetical protein
MYHSLLVYNLLALQEQEQTRCGAEVIRNQTAFDEFYQQNGNGLIIELSVVFPESMSFASNTCGRMNYGLVF